jgi:arsenite methyltransferase
LGSSAARSSARDCWADWIAERRFGGDPEVAREFLERLSAVRDRVLAKAHLPDGAVLLDVGCGDGLIAFGALDLVGEGGEVIFADISEDLLDECRARATKLAAAERCRFVTCGADDLSPLPDACVDAVTTRSVLIYVKDKARAFQEFARVLKRGGRISLYEPINRFASCAESENRFSAYDLSPVPEIAAKLNAAYDAIQPPDSDPMLDFDERDLIRLAEQAGFFPIELEYNAEVRPIEPRPWETFLHMSGNPKIPTVGEAIDQALTPAERDRLTEVLRPLVEQGRGVWRMGHALLSGAKAG